MPEELSLKLKNNYNLDIKQILDKVYRQPQPALYLSSFADFLLENKTDTFVENLVKEGFNKYCNLYLLPISAQYPVRPLHMAGTVASGFEDWLREIAKNNNLTITTVVKEPIYNVLNYYSDKN